MPKVQKPVNPDSTLGVTKERKQSPSTNLKSLGNSQGKSLVRPQRSIAKAAELDKLKIGMSHVHQGGKKTKPHRKSPPESRDLATLVVKAALEHKIISPVLLNLTGISQITDFFYIASLDNPRQVKSVAEKIVLRVKEAGGSTLGVEGISASDTRWALIDLGDVIVHLFLPEARELYDLEGLWADAPRVDMKSLGLRKKKL
jgi:ribosome-associated protein